MSESTAEHARHRGVPRALPIVRIKLGVDRPAPAPDPLGRDRIGYRPGLTPGDLWERGRGVWKAKLATVAEAALAVLVAEETVQLVGSIEGVSFHDDRVAITGRHLPQHPLIGSTDPIPNASRNPIAYGTITTLPADALPPTVERLGYGEVVAGAVDALTTAVHWERPVLQQNENGRWEPHPTKTEPGDWAELVALALAGAAANAGGIEAALAGRPGSWEAEGVRELLVSTVGEDEAHLWGHRTEPLRLTIYVDELVTDIAYEFHEAYDDALDEARRRYDAAEAEDPEPDYGQYVWTYDRTETGDFLPQETQAPTWSWEAWRTQPRRPWEDDEYIRAVEDSLRTGVGLFTGRAGDAATVYIAKSPAAAEELWRLEDERDVRLQAVADLEEDLVQQRLAELRTYGDALAAHVKELATEVPGLAVPVEVAVDVDTFQPEAHTSDAFLTSLEGRLLAQAIASTPSPAQLTGTPLDRLPQTAS